MVSNKIPITAHLNNLVIEKLFSSAPKGKRSAYADEVLSRKFGITYEEAFPEDEGTKKKRKWIGVFKK